MHIIKSRLQQIDEYNEQITRLERQLEALKRDRARVQLHYDRSQFAMGLTDIDPDAEHRS